VITTDRGRAVAAIVRKREPVIERGVREGWIRPAKWDSNWAPRPKPVSGLPRERLMAELEQDREDRL
jgi:hypothetical protein